MFCKRFVTLLCYVNSRFSSFTIAADDPSLLPCPQTLLQALADRGRFTTDEYCNPDAEEHCVLYHYGVTHCFRTNTPR